MYILLVYKDLIISTIVDLNSVCITLNSVYNDLIISTIVDSNSVSKESAESIMT